MKAFIHRVYVIFVVTFYVCGVSFLSGQVERFVSNGWVHQNPWNKEWFFGPAPDYDRMAREELQVRSWYSL